MTTVQSRLANAAWISWLAGATALTTPLLVRYIKFFGHPGARYPYYLLAASCVFAAGVPLYHRLRIRGLWRYEPAVVALPLAAGLIYQTRATLVVAWIMVAAYALGWSVLNRAGLRAESPVEAVALPSGVGLALLSIVTFFLGLAHGYYPSVFALLLATVCAACFGGIPALWKALQSLLSAWREAGELRDGFATLGLAFGIVFAAAASMVVLAPSLAFDVLRYHLVEVMVYNARHALAIVPFLNIGYSPQNSELLMTLAYSLGGQPAAQMTPPLFFALALLMTFALARRARASRLGAAIGTLFAATIPFLHWTGSVAKNDLALAFYLLAALHTYLCWQESGKFAWIRLGAFFVAAAAGVKPTAVFGLPPLAILYFLAAWRQPRRWRAMGSLAAIFALFGLYWYVRAWALTGNPVYPFALRAAVSTAAGRTRQPATPLLYLQLSWRLHFAGQDYFASPLANPLGVFFVLFAPIWFLLRRRAHRAQRACLVFVAGYIVYWAIADPDLRFACAPILLLAALTGSRLFALYAASRPWAKKFILAAAAYCLSFALGATLIVEVNEPQLHLFAGKLDSRGYLRQALVTYSSLEYLATQTAPGDRVLSAENESAAYAPDPAAFDCFSLRLGGSFWPTLEQRARQDGSRFLISPAAAGEPPQSMRAEMLYRDPAFSVYRLPQADAGRAEPRPTQRGGP
ncbi:MAG TPA: hypothetical protein VJN43_20795 [Bryobacteraceae bacterium]|nr:hypothetical protein [Bryobacteraceae bacterium]